jgi:L-threonylcarbamoyladenylate synthase
MPNNKIALDLAKFLKRPITATSANVSGKNDCYSAHEIISQFQNQKNKPDIIINAGTLPKRKPSTIVKIQNHNVEILREGPISKKQIILTIAKIDGRQF